MRNIKLSTILKAVSEYEKDLADKGVNLYRGGGNVDPMENPERQIKWHPRDSRETTDITKESGDIEKEIKDKNGVEKNYNFTDEELEQEWENYKESSKFTDVPIIHSIVKKILNEKTIKDSGDNIQIEDPTLEQLEKEHYQKIRKRFNGLDINIENEAGTFREGIDPDGNKWKSKMYYDYGEIASTVASDNDNIDVYLGPDVNAEFAYIVHQMTRGDWGKYDEDKVMLGFKSEAEAKKVYLMHFDDKRYFGSITKMKFKDFKNYALNNVSPHPVVKDEKTKERLLK